MGSHGSLGDRKFLQVSRTLLGILGDIINALVWMVSTFPLNSMSSSPLTNPLGIVSSALITIGITVTFTFHSFLVILQGLYTYLFVRFLLVLLCGLSGPQSPLFVLFSFIFDSH